MFTYMATNGIINHRKNNYQNNINIVNYYLKISSSFIDIFFAYIKLGIFYKSDDTMDRQRFTIAHEIAHCCLDTDSLKQRHLEKSLRKRQFVFVFT